MAGRDTTMAGDLAGDITRHFDGTADTASLNACQSLATGEFSQQLEKLGFRFDEASFPAQTRRLEIVN
jgi:hypothetical protein